MSMGDSDDERDSRPSRDKFKRERQDPDVRNSNYYSSQSSTGGGYVQRDFHGMRKSGDLNRNQGRTLMYSNERDASHAQDEPPLKRLREHGNGGDHIRKISRRDEETRSPLNKRGDESFETETRNRHGNSQTSSSYKPNPPISNGPAPGNQLVILGSTPMMTLKQFLMTQDDHINDEDAMIKYREYKEEFTRQQLKFFFQAHKDEPWFIEKYHPKHYETRMSIQAANIRQRLNVFMKFYRENKLPINSGCGVQMKNSKELIKFMDSVVILLEGGTENDLRVLDDDFKPSTPEKGPSFTCAASPENSESLEEDDTTKSEGSGKPRPLHKTNSIYLRTLAPTLSREEIEEICRAHLGFKRLALQDPQAEMKFFRRGWATYSAETNASIKEICWKVNNVRIKDTELSAIVNRELSVRVRPVNAITCHSSQMRHDLKLIVQLIEKLDERRNLWSSSDSRNSNPLLHKIAEHLIVEDSSEEDALLRREQSMSEGGKDKSFEFEEDLTLRQVFDRLLLYLRIVHSVDYYSAAEYAGEDEMPHKCGIIHARGPIEEVEEPLTKQRLADYVKEFEVKYLRMVQSLEPLSEVECKKLGIQDVEAAVEAFMKENIQELAKDRWLCPLSGKKFKGPEFVRKHILTKHIDKLEAEKNAVLFFNNYIGDRHRPQPLIPPSVTNPPNNSATDHSRSVDQSKFSRYQNSGRREGSYEGRRYQGEGGRYSGGRGNPDYGNDNYSENRRYSGGGGFYRGGNRGGFRSRDGFQGRGRYSERAIISYVDLDAPPKD